MSNPTSISSRTRRSIQVLIASLAPMFAWAGPVDINKADAPTIAKELQGIGLSKAQAIVVMLEGLGQRSAQRAPGCHRVIGPELRNDAFAALSIDTGIGAHGAAGLLQPDI